MIEVSKGLAWNCQRAKPGCVVSIPVSEKVPQTVDDTSLCQRLAINALKMAPRASHPSLGITHIGPGVVDGFVPSRDVSVRIVGYEVGISDV